MTTNGIYDQQSGKLLIQFDSYIDNTYHNSNTVAFEPLENGSFSSDSKQDTPYQISITAIKTITKNPDLIQGTVNQIKQALEDLTQSATLVKVVLQPLVKQSQSKNSLYSELGKVYESIVLYSLDYQNTPDQLEFRPVMLFQQIRLTNTEYTASQNTVNPENTSTVNQGQKQPTTTNTTLLEDIKNYLFGGG